MNVPDQIRRDAQCCPNCTEHGSQDLSQDGFEEWRCTNENCRVEVYRVRIDSSGRDQNE